MSWTGSLEFWERLEEIADPPLTIRHFPLQRGYHRPPFSMLSRWGSRQTARMQRLSDDPRQSPLICTTPFYAPVAERWPGPVVYYQTDLTYGYAGIDPSQVRSLDRRLCHVASAVCPNSRRVADYMVDLCGCDPAKIEIVPNATRQSNILPFPPTGPGPAPADMRDLSRPIVGVLGNLAANLNWTLLLDAVEKTPEYTWAFIGPTSMPVTDPSHNEARQELLRMGGRVQFLGSKPYGLLQDYARAIDCAVLPYRRKEPTFSGSSTRFYEHLAACRPMLATRGFEELLHKEPLLRLVDTADQMASELGTLAQNGFADGLEEARWKASQQGTWEVRAATLMGALRTRLPGQLSIKPKAELPEVWCEEYRSGTRAGAFTLVAPD